MTAQPKVTALVGAQWGDEGKGKWVDILAASTDIICRYQGGNNAGHTLILDGRKVVLHQVPSGIFREGQVGVLASGVVVNPTELITELEKLRGENISITPERLWLSARAHVITPWHIQLDAARETRAARPIGTTRRGIGPTYAEKAARSGLRLGHFVNPKARQSWLDQMAKEEPAFRAHFDAEHEVWRRFEAAAAHLLPFVCDAEAKVRSAVRQGKRLLMEGAQGALLDIDHGTYPYVTSSSTGVAGAIQSLGLAPRLIDRTIGIAKAYLTRVGEGPMPTELKDDVGKVLATRGHEFGATTGRPRRVGWLDAVALRYASAVNGFDGIVLNKMDILTGLSEIKIATAYRHPTLSEITDFPWDTDVLAACTPVYQSYPGWSEAVPNTGTFATLPRQALAYIRAVEECVGVPVVMVGTGPGRADALYPA